MADDLAGVDRTEMISAHVAAYHKFSLLVKWVMVVAASLISFLALWFASPAGFWAGLIVGVIVFSAGTYALRHGWAHSSESGSLTYPQAH